MGHSGGPNVTPRIGSSHPHRPEGVTEDARKGQNFKAKHNIHLFFFKNFVYLPIVDGSCIGILCLSEFDDNVALWNPSTREFKILPQSTVQRPPGLEYTSCDCLGFGYDSQTDDFKVVIFVVNYFSWENEEGLSIYSHSIDQVELYSLKSDSWKEISFPGVDAFAFALFNNYVNGFIYCQAVGIDHLILSFDMVNEKFSTSPLPEFGGSLEQYYLELLEFNGLLGAIFYPREGTDKCFDLWVVNGSWTKQFSVESILGVERPLGFWKNGELFLESSDQELVLFDPSIQELINLGIHAYQETMRITAYVESLVPLNGRSEHEECIIRRPAEENQIDVEH
ncbi:F-box/kelch-repeat protein At3g06240-like [Hibiscus syriacus]|uniref:F-box/kelch-repeat protein At3g06240-like n=1 Tax=Hibiscus syriacus TaxID=106335 RepID=UPI001924495A|nr:F-box/kelch-repeat protein At3g06240-like [Hibiscus syriacus]